MPSMGDLVTHLVADSSRFKSGLSVAQSSLASFATSAATSLGAIAAGFASFSTAQSAIFAAEEDIKATRKLNTALEATGYVSGVTADEINKMATELQRVTAFEDDATVNAAALLTRFKSIRGDVFRDAIKSAQDLSAFLDQDLTSSVTMLGKALENPRAGLAALSRAGIVFTEREKEAIAAMAEFDDIAGAQRRILDELKTRVGGSAEATVTATDRMSLALGTLKERLGKEMLPAIDLFSSQVVPAIYAGEDAMEAAGEEAITAETHMKNFALSLLFPNPVANLKQIRDIIHDIAEETEVAKEQIEGIIHTPNEDFTVEPKAGPSQDVQFSEDAASRFADRIRDVQLELDVMFGDITENEAAMRRAMAEGLDPQIAEQLKERLNTLDAIKEVKRQEKEIDDKAAAIRESVMTPQETLDAKIAELEALKSAGEIDQETFDRAKKKAEEAAGTGVDLKDKGSVGAAVKGSAEALSAIFKAGRDDIGKKQLEVEQEQLAQLERAVDSLDKMARAEGVMLSAGSLA